MYAISVFIIFLLGCNKFMDKRFGKLLLVFLIRLSHVIFLIEDIYVLLCLCFLWTMKYLQLLIGLQFIILGIFLNFLVSVLYSHKNNPYGIRTPCDHMGLRHTFRSVVGFWDSVLSLCQSISLQICFLCRLNSFLLSLT